MFIAEPARLRAHLRHNEVDRHGTSAETDEQEALNDSYIPARLLLLPVRRRLLLSESSFTAIANVIPLNSMLCVSHVLSAAC